MAYEGNQPITSKRWYVSSNGKDSFGGNTIELPFLTITHALSVASSGDTIILLNNITETTVALKPNILLVGDGGYPTLTVTNLTLGSGWGTGVVNQTLFIQGINLTVTNAISWDATAFSNARFYFFRLYDLTLTNANGFTLKGVFDSGTHQSMVLFQGLSLATATKDTLITSLCDMTFDTGIMAHFDPNCVIGAVRGKSSRSNGQCNIFLDNAHVQGNDAFEGIILYSPLASLTNASVFVKTYDTFQNVQTQFITLSQSMGNGNIIELEQGPLNYRADVAISGTGVIGIDYALLANNAADTISFNRSTSAWIPVNFSPSVDPIQLTTTLTQMLAGIDDKLGLSPSLPNDYLNGFTIQQGTLVSNLQVITTDDMTAKDSTNTSTITATNTTLFVSNGLTGAGGLDTGSASNNTSYYIFIIWDSTGMSANSLLMSLNATPSPMPTGWDKFRCIGTWKTQVASTNFINKLQVGLGTYRKYYLEDAYSEINALSNGSSTTAATVNLQPLISPLCTTGNFQYRFNPSVVNGNFSISPTGLNNFVRAISVTAAGSSFGMMPFVAAGGQIDYQVNSALNSVFLWVLDYDEQL